LTRRRQRNKQHKTCNGRLHPKPKGRRGNRGCEGPTQQCGPLKRVINFRMSQTKGKFSSTAFINKLIDSLHYLGQ